MNCMALEQRGEILLVDCGVTFDDRGLGVDVVHPDFAPLDAWRDRIRGVVITHGHEDHIGALPYLLRRFDVPVWGPPYAMGLVRERLAEHEVLQHARLFEVRPREAYDVGSFRVEHVRVTHSIADATALALGTSIGTVIHTGDFKIDPTPPDEEAFDEARLRELGDAGVSLLLSDSTNIDAQGDAGSEKLVGEALLPIVGAAKQAVIVALFASNVHRLRMLGEIARETGRKIVPLGRSIHTHSKVAHATGYLDWPSDLVFPADRVGELPRDKILGLATGSQAEARAALARLARGDHPAMKLERGDLVLLSSRIIPGNEPSVYALLNDLYRLGVDVRTRATDRAIHVSGHAHRGEQRKMIELVRPRAFVPVHGTMHHLLRHAELAREVGVPTVCVVENGDVARATRSESSSVTVEREPERLASGRVYTWAGRAVPRSVLRERSWLAESGSAVVIVTLQPPPAPHDVVIRTKGVIDETADADLLAEVAREVRAAIAEEETRSREIGEIAPRDEALSDAARMATRRTFGKTLGSKPLTLVVLSKNRGPAP